MARHKRSTTRMERGGRGGGRAADILRSEAASSRRDATTMLIDDHDHVRELVRRALEAQDSTRQMDLLIRIRRAFEIHSRLEEQVLYPALERLGVEWGHRVDDYEREHQELRAMLREVVTTDLDGEPVDDIESRIEAIQESLDAHTGDEEERAFPEIEERLGSAELRSIERRMIQIRQTLDAAAEGDLDDEDLEADFSEGRDDDPLPR